MTITTIAPGKPADWLTVEECAAWLRISRTTAYAMCQPSGGMPGVLRIGRIVRVNRHELETWALERAGTDS